MSRVNPNPQLGFDDNVLYLKQTLATILRDHANLLNFFGDGFALITVTAPTYDEIRKEGEVLILCDCTANAITVKLPNAQGNKLKLHVKKIDSSVNAVIIDGLGTQTIDGAFSKSLSTQYASLTLVSNNANWMLI